MIDFRYHLVSIIAIFLALAVGLLVGSTFISGYAQEALTHAQHVLSQQNKSLRTQNGALGQQITADQAFAAASAQRLLDPGGTGLLVGKKVVLVVAPGASSAMTSGVMTALGQAGATVTGQVMLQSQFFDNGAPAESSLTQLAQQFAPQAGVQLPGTVPYPAVQGQQDATAVIAAAILTGTGTGLPGSVSQAVLSAFVHGGFLQVSGKTQAGTNTIAPADLAVLLTPDSTPPQQSVSQALVAVAAQLKSAGAGTVMAGSVSAIGPGSAISLEPSPPAVSTVDNADTESGQIMVAQALALLAAGKAPQAYGITPAAAPSLAPAPSATPSANSTPATKPKGNHS